MVYYFRIPKVYWNILCVYACTSRSLPPFIFSSFSNKPKPVENPASALKSMLNERTFFPEHVARRLTFNGRLLFYFAFSGPADHVHPYLKQPAVRVIKHRATSTVRSLKPRLHLSPPFES